MYRKYNKNRPINKHMKLRLFLYLLLALAWPALGSSAATVVGVVVNGSNGSPLSGAVVSQIGRAHV